MAEAGDGPTQEEQLMISKHFLVNSPPGQFNFVLEDVKVLVPPNVVDPQVPVFSRDFNLRNTRVIREGTPVPLILCKPGEVAPDRYLEPKSNTVYTVDHAAMKVVGGGVAAAGPMDLGCEALRLALQDAAAQHVEAKYAPSTTAAAVYAAPSELTLVISGEKLNLRNFWSGQFLSTWVVKLAPEGPSVTGEIKVRAHYFEEGNVQLQTKKAVPAITLPLALGDDLASSASLAGELASGVVAHVASAERALQEGLEEMYATMTEETFKAMRRVMPVHRNKMNWNVNEVKLNANLTKK